MAKYIIDVPKNWVDITNGLHIPIEKCGNVGNLRIDTGLKLTPYTEPDEQAFEKATNEGWLFGEKYGVGEAWEFAMKCLSMDGNDFYEIFDSCDALCLTNLSYEEAKTKYEDWKAEKDKIRVGDEVEYSCPNGTCRFVAFGIVGNTAYGFKYPCDFDDVGEYCDIDMLTKTGRHFPEVEKLVEKMSCRDILF